MKNQIKIIAVSALLALPVSVFAANNDWYNPKTWFKKSEKLSSTTVTGSVDSVKEQVIFKTLDGQLLVLVGNKSADVGKCNKDAKIRVFGNVYKPSDKYPTGALQVRNFRILEENGSTSETSSSEAVEPEKVPVEPVQYEEPAPYEEPVLEKEVNPSNEDATKDVESVSNADDAVVETVKTVEAAEEAKDETAEEKPVSKAKAKTYVVKSGDTLGKISSKVFGTTASWKKIAEANGITNPKHLKVGMTLNIPE